MPVTIDEVSAEVAPPTAEPPPTRPDVSPTPSLETESRRLRELLNRLAQREERLRAD